MYCSNKKASISLKLTKTVESCPGKVDLVIQYPSLEVFLKQHMEMYGVLIVSKALVQAVRFQNRAGKDT